MTENICELCGEPMPEGEEMFRYHGYSGPCPKPSLPSESQGNSEEAAFRKAMSQPAEVWYPCGCKASPGAPKHCPEHHCDVCGKNTIEYVQGIKHSDGTDLCEEETMVLAGRVWNTLDSDDRMRLLRHCGTITHESIKQHEATLSWQKLMPVTQNDLLSLDFSGILGRDVTP